MKEPPPALLAPGAPTGVRALAGRAQAEVRWEAPADDGGTAITGYTVTSSPGGLTVQVTTTHALVAGLLNGTAYTFMVTATNAVGTGPASAPSNAVTPAMAPSAPASVIAMAANARATVSWTAPVDDGGSPISGYLVRGLLGEVFGSTTGVTQLVISGLSNGSSYAFTVTAVNDAGSSALSPFSNTVTPSAVPDAPTGVSATASSERAVVSWSAPLEQGGSEVTRYTVTSDPGGLSASTDGATRATVLGLINGTGYTFTVTASNAVGTGPASQPSNAVTPATLPGTPSGVVAVGGNAEATASWSAPFDDGGAPITQYTVTANPGGLTGSSSGGLTATVRGLTNGTSYTFTVRATNAAGLGLPSAPSSAIIPLSVPGAPTAVTAIRGDAQATVSWTAPADVGGTPLTSYAVTASPAGGAATIWGTQATVSGLVNGTSYTFTVRAVNAVGPGAPSDPSNAVTPAALPSAPAAVVAAAGNGGATVSWTAPADNGSPITGYTVTSNGGGFSVTTTGATSVTIAGLTNGSTYTFRVTATNGLGSGPSSAPSNAVTPATLPGTPTDVIAVPGNRQVTLTWASAPPNGNLINAHTITVSPGGAVFVTGGALTAVITGLTNGTSYTFTVAATNGYGTGPASAPSNAVSPRTLPGAPTGVVAIGATGQATVSWTAPADDGASPVTNYQVNSVPSGVSVTVSASAPQAVITGLVWSANYAFTVRALNAAGWSVPSTPSGVVALFSPACSGTVVLGGELPTVTTRVNPSSIRLADFDGDGRLDLVVADNPSNAISLRRGNGDGTFQAAVNSAVAPGQGERFLAVGDLNGDGRPDLAVSNTAASAVSVLLGQPDGTLGPLMGSPVPTAVTSLAIADLDADGLPDLVAGTTSVALFLRGNGTGNFQNIPIPTPVAAMYVALGDFDGDGKFDLASAYATTLRIQLGNGDGSFMAPRLVTLPGNSTSISSADLNGDGRADVAVTNGNGVTVLLNVPGAGPPNPVTYATGPGADSLAGADVSGDGLLDLVVASSGGSTVAVLLGSSTGTFGAATSFAVPGQPRTILLADVTGDGEPDVVLACAAAASVRVFPGKGDGTFPATPTLAVGTTPIGLASGDFNGDGLVDLAVANFDGASVSVALSLGNGSFGAPTTSAVGLDVMAVLAVDLDADGKLDLLATNRRSGNLSFLRGTGTGGFQAAVTIAAGSGASWTTAADLNDDGKVDLVIANYTGNSLTVLLASGGGFLAPITVPVAGGPHSVVAADFNGDGKKDLAVVLFNDSKVALFAGNGTGAFVPAASWVTGTNPRALTVGDFDGDGALDLAVAHYAAAWISVSKGNGNGTFQTEVNYAAASAQASLVASDVDGDGKLDLVAPNWDTRSVSVYRGKADGTFQAALSYAVGPTPYAAVVADFNGDGSPDLAVANSGSRDVTVLLRTACLP